MPVWMMVLLVLIAVAGLAQACFLVALAREGARAGRRLDALALDLGREVQPALANFEKAARQFAEVSDLAVLQARRVDVVITDAVVQIERTHAALREVVLPTAGRIAAATAAIRVARSAYELYRRIRG